MDVSEDILTRNYSGMKFDEVLEYLRASTTVTLNLRLTSLVTNFEPMYPAPPVIKIFFIMFFYNNFVFLSL